MVKSFNFLELHVPVFSPFPGQRPTMLELYNTISSLGERYGVINDTEMLRQSEIATPSISNDIVEV